MSTEYTTDPPIKYEDFLAKTSVELSDPEEPVYVMDHKCCHWNGTYIYVYRNSEGNAEFERWGVNRAENFFPIVESEFNVKVYDEFGQRFDGSRDYDSRY